MVEISSSGQLASQISGAFTSGFEFSNTISGSTSTGSFGLLEFDSFTASLTRWSGLSGLPSFGGFISSFKLQI